MTDREKLLAIMGIINRAKNEKLGCALLTTKDLTMILKVYSKKPKPESRAARWSRAAGEAVAALEELVEIQQEFQEWHDNLDGKFEGSPLVEKLENITGIDLESAKEAVDDAEGADVPLGFGRD